MAKISFAVGAKHESTGLTSTIANPLDKYSHLQQGCSTDRTAARNNVRTITDQTSKAPVPSLTANKPPALQSEPATLRAASTTSAALDDSKHFDHCATRPIRSQKHSFDMAEPPVKRAKRTDSAAMWERTSKTTDSRDKPRDTPAETKSKEGRDRKDDKRKHGREERTRRSRSRSRERRRDRDGERRKDRSRSEERIGGRPVNGNHSPPRERDGKRRRDGERRDRDRSHASILARKLTHRSKGDPPPRRPDRHRSRSRSPARDPKSSIRTRSPPRGPSSKPPPSGPAKPSRSSLSPAPTKAPPKGPQSTTLLPKTNGTTSSAPSDPKAATAASTSKMVIDEDSDPETAQMRRMMGFADFKTTKNTKVPGNDVYAVRKEKKTEYRQYMNRVGGFNRPLSPSR
ncbi:MAG: hypothetical protein Q9171_007045 [Xanthocarpia ochracea]